MVGQVFSPSPPLPSPTFWHRYSSCGNGVEVRERLFPSFGAASQLCQWGRIRPFCRPVRLPTLSKGPSGLPPATRPKAAKEAPGTLQGGSQSCPGVGGLIPRDRFQAHPGGLASRPQTRRRPLRPPGKASPGCAVLSPVPTGHPQFRGLAVLRVGRKLWQRLSPRPRLDRVLLLCPQSSRAQPTPPTSPA